MGFSPRVLYLIRKTRATCLSPPLKDLRKLNEEAIFLGLRLFSLRMLRSGPVGAAAMFSGVLLVLASSYRKRALGERPNASWSSAQSEQQGLLP